YLFYSMTDQENLPRYVKANYLVIDAAELLKLVENNAISDTGGNNCRCAGGGAAYERLQSKGRRKRKTRH
ncbi:MAG: hypothetical protein J6V14_01785, partial [Clostridia bacterium]|nr:hypothetical protein [Clostridia bacterium]